MIINDNDDDDDNNNNNKDSHNNDDNHIDTLIMTIKIILGSYISFLS